LSIDSQIVHYSVRVKFSSRLNPSLAAYWLDRIGYSCLLHFPADRLFLRQPLARHTVIVFGRKIKERIRSKQGGNRTRTGRNRAAAFRNALWNRLQHWTTFITCRGTLSVASSGGHLPLHYYACNRDATLDVILYLVQEEYPESLQVTNSSGKRPIDLAKRPPLHEVVAWLESALAGGVAFELLSSPQLSVPAVIELTSILPPRRSSHRYHYTLSMHPPSTKKDLARSRVSRRAYQRPHYRPTATRELCCPT
jgi:hypothetical protein